MASESSVTIRRPRSEEERQIPGGGQFLTLDEDNPKFVGTALFEGDPSKDEPGYFEYFEHWHPAMKSVPCQGDGCALCEDGDRPRLRAKSLWQIDGELMIFNLNNPLIKQFTELRNEGDKVLGRTFRVTRLDDRGNYALYPKTEMMKVGDVKALLKSDDAPDLENIVVSNLKKKKEQLKVAAALSDDDDEPTDSTRKQAPESDEDEPAEKGGGAKGAAAKGGAAKPSPAKEEVPDEAEDVEVTIIEHLDNNQIHAEGESWEEPIVLWGTSDLDTSDYGDGEVVNVSFAKDGDGDYVLSAIESTGTAPDAEPETEPEPDEPATTSEGEYTDADSLPDEIEDQVFTVISVNAEEETLDVESDELGLKFKLYFLAQGPASKVDFDDYKVDAKVTFSAVKDSQGDMVATTIPKAAKAKRK